MSWHLETWIFKCLAYQCNLIHLWIIFQVFTSEYPSHKRKRLTPFTQERLRDSRRVQHVSLQHTDAGTYACIHKRTTKTHTQMQTQTQTCMMITSMKTCMPCTHTCTGKHTRSQRFADMDILYMSSNKHTETHVCTHAWLHTYMHTDTNTLSDSELSQMAHAALFGSLFS